MTDKALLLACSNCYRAQPWDGTLENTECHRCGKPIPVSSLATALVHLFSCAAFDGRHDVMENEDGDGLLAWLTNMVWGDGMRGGRRNWVDAGCPVTIDDFCTAIMASSPISISSISCLLQGSTQPPMLQQENAREAISLTACRKLEQAIETPGDGAINDPFQISSRMALYEILAACPSRQALTVLERCLTKWPSFDGDRERESINGRLMDAVARCRQCEPL